MRNHWRSTLGAFIALGLIGASSIASAQVNPAVSPTEIKIGQTFAYSGPASAGGVQGKLERAYFNEMVNELGGAAGRKVNLISYDDGYSPPKTVEQVRRLVEVDEVLFIFNSLGTPTNSAVQRYLNQKHVPQLFVSSGANKWGNYQQFPWTIGWQPSYRTEAQVYARFMLHQKPDAKLAILFQNDDFGKDYPAGVRDVLGERYSEVVTEATYEATDPGVASQIISLQASGANALLLAAGPKFTALAIRTVHDHGWAPMLFLSNVSTSVGAVIQPAGPENAIGVLTGQFLKDPTDPRWNGDSGMREWHAFMDKYLPGADKTDSYYVTGYAVSHTMLQVLRQCDGDFSRENIMKQATNLHDLDNPLLLPGIRINTSPTNFRPITAMQLARWNGKTWELFGAVIQGTGS
ncbi:MAG TPA: ABC transporter substrate-binding protein [Acetobacteraceae bacterium]|nr:ABC transporter substrate-binding protein [Acetobacteraceae bacterium]